MIQKKTLILGLVMLLSLGFMASCSKEDNGNDKGNGNDQKATVRFNLTDAPADYDAVLIEIVEVRVHVGDDDDPNDNGPGWVTLDEDFHPGIYDLLELQNGLDTVLAEDDVPAGKLSQIRLILGDENSVVINGISHDLKTPSAQQSGLKLKVNYELEPGLYYEFWLDFDASRSIVEKGNGDYNLKPVIRVFTKNTTGAIDGYVDPVNAQPTVLVYDADDTASAIADKTTGYYLLSGLDAGSYTVEAIPVAPFSNQTKNGVGVTVGTVTRMDTIFF